MLNYYSYYSIELAFFVSLHYAYVYIIGLPQVRIILAREDAELLLSTCLALFVQIVLQILVLLDQLFSLFPVLALV